MSQNEGYPRLDESGLIVPQTSLCCNATFSLNAEEPMAKTDDAVAAKARM